MSKILLEWLNSDVRLSREVVSIEDDFRDGYLIAELLDRYNQVDNFAQFSARNSPQTKINNFTLLEPIMRQIGVHFNSKIAFDIINARAGVMKSLLYELKMSLDKISKRGLTSSEDSIPRSKIVRVINPSRPEYDKTMAATFENSMRAIMENTNDVLMDSTVRRFKEKSTEFRNTVTLGYSLSMDAASEEIQRKKEIHRHRKQHEHEFAEAWETINLNQWKVNQKIAKQRKEIRQRVFDAENTRREKHFTKSRETARQETFASIDSFNHFLETNLLGGDTEDYAQKLIKTVIGDPKEGLPSLTYVDQAFLNEGLTAAQKAMKEHNQDQLQRQQTHDQRRRRFVRERESAQTVFLQSNSEAEIVDRLLLQCEAEEREAKLQRDVKLHVHIFTRNRHNRDELIQLMTAAAEQQRATWIEEEARRELEWQVAPALISQQQRALLLEDAIGNAQRRRSTEVAAEIVEKLLDVVDWALACRDYGLFQKYFEPKDPVREDQVNTAPHEDSFIPYDVWKDAKYMFSSDFPIATVLPSPALSNIWHDLPFSLSERPAVVAVEDNLLESYQSETVLITSSRGEDLLNTLSRAPLAMIISGKDDDVESPRTSRATPQNRTLVRESDISHALSTREAVELREYFGTVNIEGSHFNNCQDPTSEEPPADSEISKFLTPNWLACTPPKYTLGEAVVKVRCAANPLPPDPPALLHLPTFYCRVCVCGVSDVARTAVCRAFETNILGVAIILLEDLISAALALGNLIEEQDRSGPKDGWKERNFKQNLAVEVAHQLHRGLPITDRQCVALICQALSELPNASPGFVLGDFPQTTEQAVLLLEALSGIRYDQRKPQPLDFQTEYAAPRPTAPEVYDVSKCGLDLALFLDTGSVQSLISERVCSRRVTATDTTVILNNSVKNVESLQELYTPTRPYNTTSIQFTRYQSTAPQLYDFFQKVIGIASLQPVPDSTALGVVAATVAETIAAKVTAAMTKDGDVEIMDDEEGYDDAEEVDTDAFNNLDISAPESILRPNDGEGSHFGSQLDLGASQDAHELDVDEEEALEAEIKARKQEELMKLIAKVQDIKFVRETPLPQQLAKALEKLWRTAEAHSNLALVSFFNSLRTIRYQLLQRRRSANDILSALLVSKDRRQAMLEEYREEFNEIDEDFRFDVDCKAELHLRALELGDNFWQLCESRKLNCETVVQTFQNDAAVQMQIHRIKCEAAALLQTELSRFITSIDVIMDCTKAVVGFDFRTQCFSILEETLPLPESLVGDSGDHAAKVVADATKKGNAAKDKAAAPAKGKGKDAGPTPPVPFRNPVAEPSLPLELMNTIPDVKAQEEVPDDKAAGKKGAAAKPPAAKGGKKGEVVEAPPADPFEAMERVVSESLAAWGKDVFTVNRLLYCEEEPVCAAVETAVWHEVERIRMSMAAIKTIVEQQTRWCETMEQTLLETLRQNIEARFTLEVSAAQCIIKLIGRAIENCDCIREEWLCAPDAVAVMTSRLVVAPPAPMVVPQVNEFFTTSLNDEQKLALREYLMQSSTHFGADTMLDEDLLELADRVLASIGPLGFVKCPSNLLTALNFPKQWRSFSAAVPRDAAGDNEIPIPRYPSPDGASSSAAILQTGSSLEQDFGAETDAAGKTAATLGVADWEGGEADQVLPATVESFAPLTASNRIELLSSLLPERKLVGVDEHQGTVSASDMFDILAVKLA